MENKIIINKIEYKIRNCRKDDYQFVLKISKETIFKYIERFHKIEFKKFKIDFLNSYKYTKILLRKSRRVGIFQIEIKNEILEIVKIVISQNYQGKKIGNFLMKYFESLNQKKIILQVWENNPALNFYKKLGYLEIKKLNHKIHMEKIL